MAYMNIGRAARSGDYCDICRKFIYLNIWGHIAMHKRELQEQENRRAAKRAAKEAGEHFQNRLRGCRQ